MSDEAESHEVILVVDGDALVRHAVSEYLRHCGFRVVEAASGEEGIKLLSKSDIQPHVVLSAVELGGEIGGFALATWIRSNRPGLDVVLAGTTKRVADEAGNICDEGPELSRPYEPQQVVNWIRKIRNSPRPPRECGVSGA